MTHYKTLLRFPFLGLSLLGCSVQGSPPLGMTGGNDPWAQGEELSEELVRKRVAEDPRAATTLLELIRESINNPDANMRSAAMKLLRTLIEGDPDYIEEALPLLEAKLEDPSEAVLCAISSALAKVLRSSPHYHADRVFPLLEGLLSSSQAEVSRSAVLALHESTPVVTALEGGSERLVSVFRQGLTSTNCDVLCATIVSLVGVLRYAPRHAGDVQGMLIPLASDEDAQVRKAAHDALEALSNDPATRGQVMP